MTYKLPEDWKKITLGEISNGDSGMYGINESAVEYNSELYRYLRISDIKDDGTIDENKKVSVNIEKDEGSKYLLNKNDIVLARTGASAGRSYFYNGEEEPMIFAGFLIKFALNDTKVIPKYIKYYCQSWEYNEWVKSISTGSTRPNINASMYRNMLINLPPFEQQQLLVDTLSSIDNKIELNNKINENLEKQAQAIFKHWFVDFEFPDENGLPYKSSGGEMIDSELGLIPKKWEVKKLEDVSSVQNGYAFKSKDYVPMGCPVIRTLNIDNNLVNNNQVEYLPGKFYKDDRYKHQRLKEFDTLLVMVGSTIGKIGIILDDNIPSLQNQNMWRFRPLNSSISPFYIHYQVHKINYEVSGWDSGSARSFYRKGIFQNAKLALPQNNRMSEFNDLTLNIFKIISVNQQQNRKLSQLRDTLLPKLMSGEIRIPFELKV